MAFGGYKFKGYKVVRANLADNTYANWCLLVHHARIKAFMESCALSGAQWHFSKTNGDLSFESYGNVIYRVANANGEYHDYLSFFKYGNEELYYMLATNGEYYLSSSNGLPVQYASGLYMTSRSNSASSNPGYKIASCASSLSENPFNDMGSFSSMPSNSLSCSNQDSSGILATNSSIYNESSVTGSLARSKAYFGFCTKEKDIISFFGPNRNDCCVESGDCFSSLCDPDDTHRIAKIVLGYNTNYTVVDKNNTYTLDRRTCECLNTSGSRLNITLPIPSSGLLYNILTLVPPNNAFVLPGGSKVPYEALSLSTLAHTSGILSTNGFFVKGVIKPELICSNCFDYNHRTDLPDFGMMVMGGNMITACSAGGNATSGGTILGLDPGYGLPGTVGSLGGNKKIFPVAYVGWDASNPDINNEDSWTVLSLS